MLRGHEDEAQAIVKDIEQKVSGQKGELPQAEGTLKVRTLDTHPCATFGTRWFTPSRCSCLLAFTEWTFGITAEGQSLEFISKPIQAA